MTIEPKSHIITQNEIDNIKVLGFEFSNELLPAVAFINKCFPNCDLLLLATQIDNLLATLSSLHIFKFIELEEPTPVKFQIRYYSENYNDENNGLVLARTFLFHDEALVVMHDYFSLPKPYRGKGIAKKIFQAFIQQYINMGVKKI